MNEVSLKEHVARQQQLKVEMSGFVFHTKGECDRCSKHAGRSKINGDLLCPECWKWEVAYLEGRASRTGSIPGVGNCRPAMTRDEFTYHGTGSTQTLNRVRKGK